MTEKTPRGRKGRAAVARLLMSVAAGFVGVSAPLGAQQAPPAPGSARQLAPIDLTGYWVSVVTEDWRFRMVTPPKGDFASVPLNAEGRKMLDSWDLAKDEAAGEQCKPFGAAGLLRMPGRVRFTWESDNALRLETDAGTQTRILAFGASRQATERSWQGHSVASWEGLSQRGRPAGPVGGGFIPGGAPGGGPAGAPPAGGRGVAPGGGRGGPLGGRGANGAGDSLKVVTTQLRAGYLRKNGVPYSEDVLLTEYFNRFNEGNGDQWFVVTTVVDDPKYLNQPFVTSTHFKKEPDGAKWSPTPCHTDPPAK